MKISIRDIGVVHEADIKLDGLTVIAGANGVGKSAIGKAMYSLYKWYDSLITTITPSLKENVHSLLLELANLYSESQIDIKPFQEYLAIEEVLTYKKIHDYISHNSNLGIPKAIELIESYQIKHDTAINPETIKEGFKTVIQKMFGGNIVNNLSTDNKGSLRVSWPNGSTNIKFSGKELIDIDDQPLYPGKYVTLIDSLSSISLFQYVKENLAFQNSQNALLPNQIHDLVQKISESSYSPNYNQPISKKIQEVIQGQLVIENDQLLFKDNENNNHPIQNIASGIKSFGLIQLLLAGGKIHKDSLLIIDEPEVHLHPAWQIKYAEVLVALAKEEIPILLTSHSSTFIEAIKVYSKNEGIEKITHFYMGEMTEKGSIFKNVTESLEPIYKAFAAPSLELMLERSRGKYKRQEEKADMIQEKQIPYNKEQDD